jgi:hypothetical protein
MPDTPLARVHNFCSPQRAAMPTKLNSSTGVWKNLIALGSCYKAGNQRKSIH